MSLRLGDTAPDLTAVVRSFPNGWRALKPYLRLTPQPR